jgi:hypothetical protein
MVHCAVETSYKFPTEKKQKYVVMCIINKLKQIISHYNFKDCFAMGVI